MTDILTRLSAPFPPEKISWRVGSTTGDKKKGMALAYIDSRDVQDRLNEVCGLDWQVRHPWSDGKKLPCEIGIKVGGEWIWRGDGAGDSDVEAEKGAFSDSFKRAAVRWGVGRYLYDIDSPWVELKPVGRSYAIADHELPRLQKLLARQAGMPVRQEPTKAPEPQNDDEVRARTEANRIKAEIDNAADLNALHTVMNVNGFMADKNAAEPGSPLAFIKQVSETAFKHLRERADLRSGVLMNKPKAA